MSHDALFQLGMGSVVLIASQTEEFLAPRAVSARAEAICADASHRFGLAAFAVADLLRAERKRGGNSAKAPTLGAGSALVPTSS